MAERFGILKYNHKEDHYREGREENIVAIPENARGRLYLENTDKASTLYLALADIKRRQVVGVFISSGASYHSEERIFSVDDDDPETYPLRIKGYAIVDFKNAIPIKKFVKMLGAKQLTGGSIQRLDQDVFVRLQTHFSKGE